ncbi:MAG: hypothetical protein JXM69_12745 [Anaerolineae bacterium]|nr:hypothetical protein [Anaerolineae bacterium]
MELTPLLIWWLITLIFGLAGWPLAFSLLRFLPDRGFAVARPVGLLLSGYILWLGASFRLLQNNSGGIIIALGVVLTLGLVWRRQQFKAGDSMSMLGWLKREWRYVLAVELLFHVALVAWTVFKAYNPNLETAGGEKWMEIAFINGTLNSDYFPPQDPWLSGFAISYYYFGYVLMAILTRLTGLVPMIAFNLYIPTLLAMTLTGAFGIGANLVNLHQGTEQNHKLQIADSASIVTGLIAALFVAILGNLEGLLEVLHKRGFFPAQFWVWLDIRDLKKPPPGSVGRWLPPDLFTQGLPAWIPDRFIWWWRGSRVLTDYTLGGQEQEVIDEFPFFSFLLGDVHPHVLALPFVLLVVALALNLLVNCRLTAKQQSELPEQTPSTLPEQVKTILQVGWRTITEAMGGRLAFVLYAVCLGGLSFLNTWDFPIYLSVVGLAFILWLTQHRSGKIQAALAPGIIGTVMLGVTGIILYLPFYATFQSQARGILPNLWNPTRLPQFFVFFGPFLVAVAVLLIVLSLHRRGWRQHLGWSLALTILGPVLLMLTVVTGMVLGPASRHYLEGLLNNPEVQAAIGATTVGALVQESLWRRIENPWTFLLVGGLVGWTLALLLGKATSQRVSESANQRIGKSASQPFAKKEQSAANLPTSVFIEKFILILLLVGLGLTLTVEFVYLRDNFGIRMNTIFKFYFQAWVLLALGSAFALYYVSKHLRGVGLVIWQVGMALLVLGGLVYPLLAIPNKANNFRDTPTLNGIQWIAEHRPGDYAGIQWLRTNAPKDAVILEAPGAKYAAYQYTARVSAMTGLPTLLGWGGHQSQWRGNYDEPSRREPEIEELFNSLDFARTQELLDKYQITYVYIGPLERERYSAQALKKFEFLMDVVFQQDDVTIYRRK